MGENHSSRVQVREVALSGLRRWSRVGEMGRTNLVAYRTVRHQMYHNMSSVVSLVGSRVKPVRNRFSGWKEENGRVLLQGRLS